MRVTLLAYYFPPIGGVGAQRPVNFVRHLPSFGVQPSVVTGPGSPTPGQWTPLDQTLDQAVPPDLPVRRVGRSEPATETKWQGRAQRWLRRPSSWTSWLIDEFSATASQLPEADALWAVLPPYGLAIAASRASKVLGIPWIADFGDPWALDEMMVFPSGLHRRLERREMRRTLSTAAAIVMSTPEAVDRVRAAFPELRDRPIVSIPNGYDRDAFAGEIARRADGKFRIVHTGSLHTALGQKQKAAAPLRRIVGGTVNGVDILTRTHIYLMQAIERLFDEQPALRDVVEVHLAGVLSPEDVAIAPASTVSHLHGYLPHRESVALLRSADLLFLPMQNLSSGVRAGIVPGKTYEYLAAGAPILAAVPDGDVRDILRTYADADICDPDDVAAMKDAIARRIEGLPRASTPAQSIERFEYRRLTAQVAELLEEVTGAAHHERA